MNKVYVITGGGSGMGFEIARLFGEKGTVIICGRTQSKIAGAVEKLKAENIDAHGVACDISNLDSVKAFAETASKLGDIQVVVNAAGVSPTMADAKTIYSINMVGTYNIMEAFYPIMGKGKTLINIASMAGHAQVLSEEVLAVYDKAGQDGFVEAACGVYNEPYGAYNLSKRFVIEYTRRNCVKYAKVGARIVSISPGTFMTPMLGSEMEADFVKDIVANTPVGRLGDPKEIAYLAEFLSSEKAGFICGTDVLIDGGYQDFFSVKQCE